jgi:hypothetical protein
MLAALNPHVRMGLRQRGPTLAARHGWDRVARDLMRVYVAAMESADA